MTEVLGTGVGEILVANGYHLDDEAELTLVVDRPIGWPFSFGFEFTRQPFILATDNPCPEYRLDMVECGCRRIIPLTPVTHLPTVLGDVVQGWRHVEMPGTGTDLTTTERELLRFVALGMSNKQIASRRGVAPGTVKNMISRVYLKLGLSGRVDACNYYLGRWHLTSFRPTRSSAN